MPNEIYFVGFPGEAMGTHTNPVPFQVLGVEGDYLRIKLLADQPSADGFENAPTHKSGDEFAIQNQLRSGDSLLERLRSGGVAGFYTSEGPKEENLFAGTLFGYNPTTQ